jgi:hypothetical protein
VSGSKNTIFLWTYVFLPPLMILLV